jgi:hypothetical protein
MGEPNSVNKIDRGLDLADEISLAAAHVKISVADLRVVPFPPPCDGSSRRPDGFLIVSLWVAGGLRPYRPRLFGINWPSWPFFKREAEKCPVHACWRRFESRFFQNNQTGGCVPRSQGVRMRCYALPRVRTSVRRCVPGTPLVYAPLGATETGTHPSDVARTGTHPRGQIGTHPRGHGAATALRTP